MVNEMRILTVRQPWAWAIIHGGKAARRIGFARRGERIGTCPVSEFQDTPSAVRPANADGQLTSTRSAASARPTLTIWPKLVRRMSSPVATADLNAHPARCLAPSRRSASRAQLLALGRGLRRTLTSGSATAASPTSSGPTESRQNNTTTCSQHKAASALSVARRQRTREAIACTSITAMTPGESAASCAVAATAGWATSATTSRDSNQRFATSRRRSALIGGA